jgi:ArsR family transcriptional regulator
MAARRMTAEVAALVAERFRALGEPARLQIMNAMRDGERTVSALVEATGLSTGNVSKHLQVLYGTGFVTRRKEGVQVYYGLANKDVFRLCDIVCGQLEADAVERRRVLTGR